MSGNAPIARAEILPMPDYSARRRDLRRELSALRGGRRIEVGPFVTFSFESRRTVWHQIHEMLFIEKGGDEQIDGELAAYNPLIPNGRELVATMLIEIEDAEKRARMLGRLGGIEDAIAIRLPGGEARARPERDVERTNEAGKTSSVHFLHFPFAPDQIAAFRRPGTEIVLAIAHPQYGHMAILSEPLRASLAQDFAD